MFNEEEDVLGLLGSALQTKNIHLMKNILRRNSELIKYKNKLGENLIHHAVKYNFKEFLELLIENGLNIDTADSCNRTPLHFAISAENEDMVRCLLEHKASTSIKNLYGKSPFHLAVNFGNLRIIELLLKNGADIMDTTLNTNQTAFHIALRNEDEATFKLLLTNFSGNVNVSDKYGETLLHTLARQRNESLAKLLIDRGADVNIVNEDNETSLHFAVHHRNFSMSKLFVDNCANVNIKNKYDESPLHLAIRYKDVKLLKLLLSYNANVNELTKNRDTMLHVAVGYYNTEVVDLLIESGVDIDTKNLHGLTPFHMAIKNKCMDAAQQLLQYSVDVNTVAFGKFIWKERESQNFTPLHTGIVQKDLLAVDFLLKNGATLENDREIFLAVESGSATIVDLLIQHGANVNATNTSGQSLLYMAMKSRDMDKVEMLLHRGADRRYINDTDLDNESALHAAVRAKDEKFVQFLLDIGLDVNICNADGSTALCLAQGQRNIANSIVAIVALLKINESFVCKNNEDAMNVVPEFASYFAKCTEELKMIGGTRYCDVSLIQFLRDDVTVWGKYVRKDGMFKATIDENRYPTYWRKLLSNIDRGLKRWRLIRRVKDTLCGFQCFQPLYDVLDDIVDNFNDDELNSFILHLNEQ